MEGYSWLPATADQQPSPSGHNSRYLPPLKKSHPWNQGWEKQKQTNIQNSIQCKKSLISVMVRNCLKFTDQQMSAWSLLLHSAKQLTKTPQSRTAAGACFARSPLPHSRIFNSIHTVQEQRRNKTSPCLTRHVEYKSRFTCFVIQQHSTRRTVHSCQTGYSNYFLGKQSIIHIYFYALPSCPILLSFSLLEPSADVQLLQERVSRVPHFMQAPSSLSLFESKQGLRPFL